MILCRVEWVGILIFLKLHNIIKETKSGKLLIDRDLMKKDLSEIAGISSTCIASWVEMKMLIQTSL